MNVLLQESDLDCLCIQESFLNHSILDHEINIDGYRTWRFDRTEESGKHGGGGLVMYTNCDREFMEVPNSALCTPHLEVAWLKLSLTQARDTYICNVYRPPDGSVEIALTTLREQIEELNIP